VPNQQEGSEGNYVSPLTTNFLDNFSGELWTGRTEGEATQEAKLIEATSHKPASLQPQLSLLSKSSESQEKMLQVMLSDIAVK
jgi:hypothetical protein